MVILHIIMSKLNLVSHKCKTTTLNYTINSIFNNTHNCKYNTIT